MFELERAWQAKRQAIPFATPPSIQDSRLCAHFRSRQHVATPPRSPPKVLLSIPVKPAINSIVQWIPKGYGQYLMIGRQFEHKILSSSKNGHVSSIVTHPCCSQYVLWILLLRFLKVSRPSTGTSTGLDQVQSALEVLRGARS